MCATRSFAQSGEPLPCFLESTFRRNRAVYAPNTIGQPTQAGPYASNISYHRNGALKQFTYGNGIVHTMSQNARQLPARNTDSGGVLDLGYVYDGNANVASITDYTTGGNQSRTLSYDTLDRLTQAVGPSFGTATYAYNVLDDITRLTVTGGNKPRDHVYNYSAGTHQLETVNNYVGGAAVIGLLYDEQGNLKNKNGQTYDFDFGNRLRNVPGKETYRYDGHGRRVYSFTTTHAVWQYSNAEQLMYSHDNRNNRKTNYVYPQGSLLAMREGAMSGGDGTYIVKYQHTDALGSPIKVTDAAGVTVETSEYEPYGHLANRALTDGPGFTGHVQDASTGLTYMQQRYYDALAGRFLSRDPMPAVSTTNFNRYSYANNNPYRFTDPDGRFSRGEGFSDEEWKKFDGVQQGTANALDAAAAQLTAALESGDFSGIDASWNKVFPDGANATNVQGMIGQLAATSAALRDRTSAQFVATGMTASQIGTKYGSEYSTKAAFNVDGTKGMVINTTRTASASQIMLGWIAGHEGLRAATGIRDIRNSQGVTAYKFGTNQASRDYFRELMSTDSSQTLVSPDHIMEFVIPQMNAAFPPPSQP